MGPPFSSYGSANDDAIPMMMAMPPMIVVPLLLDDHDLLSLSRDAHDRQSDADRSDGSKSQNELTHCCSPWGKWTRPDNALPSGAFHFFVLNGRL